MSQTGAKGRLENVERIKINGFDAATGQARIDTSEGVRDVRLVAIRFAPDRIYRFLFLTPPGTTQPSKRRLSTRDLQLQPAE